MSEYPEYFVLLHRGEIEALRRLIESAPEALTQQTPTGNTLLHEVAKAGDVDLAAFVLERGAALEPLGADGLTPVHCAVLEGHAPMVEVLLDRGAVIEARDRHGNTPLWSAVMHFDEDPAVVDVLISHGADPDLPNKHGRSPRELLAMPKNAALRDRFGKTG